MEQLNVTALENYKIQSHISPDPASSSTCLRLADKDQGWDSASNVTQVRRGEI
jgi:hypothetical protein